MRFFMPLSIVRQSLALATASVLGSVLASGAALAQPGAGAPQVMGWVPAYGIDASLKALNAASCDMVAASSPLPLG